MKKRTLALLLILALATTLAACGTTPATTSAAPGETSATSDAPADTTAGVIDPLAIKFSSTFNENETGGIVLKYFIDQLSEKSGGQITVDMSWGGTLFDAMGELDAVVDGAVNMVALAHMPHLDTLPTLSFPSFAPGSTENALDYFREIMFANEDTASIVSAEAQNLGIKYLNVIAGGANAFCAKYAFTDLDSLVAGSATFGNFDVAPFTALGFNVTPLAPPDTYDALQRGMIDATMMALAPMTMLSWYEVAPYWMLDSTYSAGNFFTVNLEWWNGLTDAQRAVIQEAATATEVYSVAMYDQGDAASIAKIEEATGNPFVQMSDADSARWWGIMFDAKAADALARAESKGITQDMTTILKVAAEFTEYDWQP